MYLQVGKGRDMGFVAVNGFEQKISAGNAMQLISRDLYRVAKGVDLHRTNPNPNPGPDANPDPDLNINPDPDLSLRLTAEPSP